MAFVAYPTQSIESVKSLDVKRFFSLMLNIPYYFVWHAPFIFTVFYLSLIFDFYTVPIGVNVLGHLLLDIYTYAVNTRE